MNKSEEVVKYMISVWDEVTGKTWREKPDHVQQKFLEAERETNASNSYSIDFDGNCKAIINIVNGELKLKAAMNGWGNRISLSDIIIEKL